MKLRAPLLLTVLAALLLMTHRTAPVAAEQHPPPTEVRVLVVAELSTLNPNLQITDRVTGSCWTGSIADPGRPDAWRCMSDNRIYDPCFVAGIEPPSVACVQTPWSAEAVLITLEEPLTFPGDPPDMLSQMPWALELAGGVRCTIASTGAGIGIAGMRVNYGCSDGSRAVGDVDRGELVWRIFVQAEGAWVLVLTPISVAWY